MPQINIEVIKVVVNNSNCDNIDVILFGLVVFLVCSTDIFVKNDDERQWNGLE